MRHASASALLAVLSCFSACGSGDDADEDGCIRYCNAANDVPECERFADCEASCAELASVFGAHCVTHRLDYYACAADVGLICVDGHAVPARHECGSQAAAVQQCATCEDYCRAADAAGCGGPACVTACEQQRAPECRNFDEFLRCHAAHGVGCVNGGAVALPSCAEEATGLRHCYRENDACLLSCVAAEVAGCPQMGNAECEAWCLAGVSSTCGEQLRWLKECEGGLGVTCQDGVPVPHELCQDQKAEYDACVNGG